MDRMHSKVARASNVKHLNSSGGDLGVSPKVSAKESAPSRNLTESPLFNPYGSSPSRAFMGSPFHQSPAVSPRKSQIAVPEYPVNQTDYVSDDVGDAFRSKVFNACTLNSIPSNKLVSPVAFKVSGFPRAPPSIDISQLQHAEPFPEMANVRIDEYFDARQTQKPQSPSSITDAFRLQVFTACSRSSREAYAARLPISPSSAMRSGVPPPNIKSGEPSAFVTAFTSPELAPVHSEPPACVSEAIVSEPAPVESEPAPVVSEPVQQVSETPKRLTFLPPHAVLTPRSAYEPPTDFMDKMNLSASPVRRSPYVSFPAQSLIGDVMMTRRQSQDATKRAVDDVPMFPTMAPEVPVHAVKRSRNEEFKIGTPSPNKEMDELDTLMQVGSIRHVSVKKGTSSVNSTAKKDSKAGPNSSGPSRAKEISPKATPAATPTIPVSPSKSSVAATPVVLSPTKSPVGPTPIMSGQSSPTKSKPTSPAKSVHAATPVVEHVSKPASPAKSVHAETPVVEQISKPASPAKPVHAASPEIEQISKPASPVKSVHSATPVAKQISKPASPVKWVQVVIPEDASATILEPAVPVDVSPASAVDDATPVAEDVSPASAVADATPVAEDVSPASAVADATPVVEDHSPAVYFAAEPKTPKRGCFARFLCP